MIELVILVALVAFVALAARFAQSPTKPEPSTPSPTPEALALPADAKRRPAWWQAAAADLSEHASAQPGAADVLKMPVPREISRRNTLELFSEHCAACHGVGGRGDGVAAPAITTGPPTNLRESAQYRFGNRELAIFRTAKYGIPHTGMAPIYASDEELWQLAAYVRTLQFKTP